MADEAEPNGDALDRDGLRRSFLSVDLADILDGERSQDPGDADPVSETPWISVVVEVRMDAALRPETAKDLLLAWFTARARAQPLALRVSERKSKISDRYVFVSATRSFLTEVAEELRKARWEESAESRAALATNSVDISEIIYRIWHDRVVSAQVYESARTLKVDVVHACYNRSGGEGVVWAVADTGVDAKHPHFALHKNFDLPNGLMHLDCSGDDKFDASRTPPEDNDGHGTHVAGIIAGEWTPRPATRKPKGWPAMAKIHRETRASTGQTKIVVETRDQAISGLAPKCKIMVLKVLTNGKTGRLSDLLVALQHLRQLNQGRSEPVVHGLNLSLGYSYDPKWFAAGASPLCNEVDRLVKSGTCVVTAAGNWGFGALSSAAGTFKAPLLGTIGDPGNAKLAITVGSTHRDKPDRYGVSYFSAKGPTADGRVKPDVVAPGERIVSCKMSPPGGAAFEASYEERSGTSMAAPHVSGVIAALLSSRSSLVGHPAAIKARLKACARSLGREPAFEGAGLVDADELIRTSFVGGNDG